MEIHCKLYQLWLKGQYLSPDIEIKIKNKKNKLEYDYFNIGNGQGGQSNYNEETTNKLNDLSNEISDKIFEMYNLIKETTKYGI